MVTFYNRKFLFAVSVWLAMPGFSLFAQPSAPQRKYPLSDLVDSARHHMPVLLQKQALVDAAKAGIRDARHSFLPDSYLGDELTAGTDNSIPGSYLSFGLIPSSSSGVRTSNIYRSAIGNIAFLSNEYELMTFGLKKAAVRKAEAGLNLSQADLDREEYLLKWQVSKLYLDILKSQFQLGIDKENVDRYDTIYKVIRAITLSGIKAGADSSLALAELSKTRETYNQTSGQLRQLQQQLSYLTGISTDHMEVDTSRTRSYLSDMGILQVNADTGAIKNPLIEYFQRQKTLYLETEEFVKKSYLPKVILTGIVWGRGSSIDDQDNYKSAASGLVYQRFNYMAGLTLEYNLFNAVHRKDKEAIIHQDMMATDYALDQQQLSLANAGNEAEEATRTALKNLVEIPIQVRSATDAFDQKTAQYKAGIINLVDLTNASYILYRSQSDYVQTFSDWLLATLDKSAVNGGLDLFIQTIK